MDQEQVGATPTGEPEKAVQFTQSVSGEQVQFGPGFAVTVQGEQNVSMANAGALSVVAGGNMEVTNGGAQVIITGGDISVTNGGGLLLVGQQASAKKGFFGIAITSQMTLSEDSRVLLDTPRAAIFGAAFGAVFGLVCLLFRRK